MIALISKQDELGRNKWVCNSSDISDGTASGGVYKATCAISGAKHGDLLTVIETTNEYIYSAPDDKWIRPAE